MIWTCNRHPTEITCCLIWTHYQPMGSESTRYLTSLNSSVQLKRSVRISLRCTFSQSERLISLFNLTERHVCNSSHVSTWARAHLTYFCVIWPVFVHLCWGVSSNLFLCCRLIKYSSSFSSVEERFPPLLLLSSCHRENTNSEYNQNKRNDTQNCTDRRVWEKRDRCDKTDRTTEQRKI